MARWKKTLAKILNTNVGWNLDFADFEGAIKGAGYTFKNQEGSHKVYTQEGWEKMVILPEAGKALPYQIRNFKKELKNHDYKLK